MTRLLTIVACLASLACSAVFDVERMHIGAGLIRRSPSERREDQALIAERLLCAGVAPPQVEAVLRGNGLDATEASKVTQLAQAASVCPAVKR